MSYLSAQCHRLTARRGAKRAVLAVAHMILVTKYHPLDLGNTYHDLGSNYFDQRDWRSVRRIEHLGYKVTLELA